MRNRPKPPGKKHPWKLTNPYPPKTPQEIKDIYELELERKITKIKYYKTRGNQ